MIGNFGFRAAVTVKDTVAKKLEEERKRKEGRITDSCSKEGKKQIDNQSDYLPYHGVRYSIICSICDKLSNFLKSKQLSNYGRSI